MDGCELGAHSPRIEIVSSGLSYGVAFQRVKVFAFRLVFGREYGRLYVYIYSNA